MRNSYWLVTFLLALECVVLLLIVEPSECLFSFIPVSVHTALQILTFLVKIKSIIFKVLLGLKLMGVEGFIMKRRKRSVASTKYSYPDDDDFQMRSLSDSQRTELLMAWKGLEKLLGKRLQFQRDVCAKAAMAGGRSTGRRSFTIWDAAFLASNVRSDDQNENYRESRRSSSGYWVSSLLGSALGSPYACHILERHLLTSNSLKQNTVPYYQADDNTLSPDLLNNSIEDATFS